MSKLRNILFWTAMAVTWAMICFGGAFAISQALGAECNMPIPISDREDSEDVQIVDVRKWRDPDSTRWGWVFLYYRDGERWMTSYTACGGVLASNPFASYNITKDELYLDFNEDCVVDKYLGPGEEPKGGPHDFDPPCEGVPL